jgi:hypothetical protein
MAVWTFGYRELITLFVKRPEMSCLSRSELNTLAKATVSFGMNDVLRALIKKGCNIELSYNEGARLETANLVAQMHAQTVMPLKYICVDAIYESILDQNKCGNQVFMHTGDEAQINWERELKGYPEEIHSLFPRKELWRWALFLDNPKKQSRIVALYQAINRRVKDPKNKHVIKLKYCTVEFCLSHTGAEGLIWIGDFDANAPKYRMLYRERAETTGGGYVDIIVTKEESHNEVLDQLLETCGWDLEDVYIFLNIISTAFVSDVDEAYLRSVLFNTFVDEFKKPPQWYLDFVRETYGIRKPKKQRYDDY